VAVPAELLPQLLTADDVAGALGLSRAQVYAVKHRIGFVRFNRQVRFEAERVRAYVESHRQGTPERIAKIDVRDL
jgi:excisionase family DNA binding protein